MPEINYAYVFLFIAAAYALQLLLTSWQAKRFFRRLKEIRKDGLTSIGLSGGKVFVPKSADGIFNASGAVDYAIGPAPGVFVIITTDQPKIKKDLNYLGLSGHGDYWSLYRPYHLANLEAPITIANVVLHQKETLNHKLPPVAETITVAKKDLHPGDVIDGLGMFTIYGMIEKVSVARAENLMPMGLAVGGRMLKPVKMGEAIRYEDIELREDDLICKLRREQDKLLYG